VSSVTTATAVIDVDLPGPVISRGGF